MMATIRFRELPALVSGKTDCFMADPRLIVVDPEYNCRDMQSAETLAHIDYLADEIEANGFLQEMPLTVRRRGDDIVLVRGHCRLAAITKLISKNVEFPGVPVMQIAAGTSDVDLLFDQESSNSGLRLDPLARARIVVKAKRMGVPEEEIRKRMHWKSVNSVRDHLELLEAPEALKQDVRDGVMSATTVRELHKDHGDAAPQVAKAAKADAASRGKQRVTRKDIARVTGKKPAQSREMTNLALDYTAIAGEVADAAKQVGGVGNLGSEKMKGFLQKAVDTLARSKGQKVEEPTQTDPARDPFLEGIQNREPALVGFDLGTEPDRTVITGTFQPSRLLTPEELLILGFITCDKPDLAHQYAKLVTEYEEANSQGSASDAQHKLCLAADAIGSLRFPDEWESAKATSELDRVA